MADSLRWSGLGAVSRLVVVSFCQIAGERVLEVQNGEMGFDGGIASRQGEYVIVFLVMLAFLESLFIGWSVPLNTSNFPRVFVPSFSNRKNSILMMNKDKRQC